MNRIGIDAKQSASAVAHSICAARLHEIDNKKMPWQAAALIGTAELVRGRTSNAQQGS